MSYTIRDWFHPLTPPKQIADLLTRKLYELENQLRKEQQDISDDERRAGEAHYRKLSELPTADQELVTDYWEARKRADILREQIDEKFDYTDSTAKNVRVKLSDDQRKQYNRVISDRRDELNKRRKVNTAALQEIGLKMMDAHIAQVRLKIPQELLTALDSLGKSSVDLKSDS